MKRLLLALTLFASTAHADAGYLNQHGCHYGSTDGWRGMWHCHHMARSYYTDRGLVTDPPVTTNPGYNHGNSPTHGHSNGHNNSNDALNVLLGIVILDALLGK